MEQTNGSAAHARVSRRKFLAGSAALAAGAMWQPVFTLRGVAAAAHCAPPPDFPVGIDLYLRGFENWARDIVIDELWTCAPTSAADVLRVVNWAHGHSYRVRPRGMMHNWSPLAVTPTDDCNGKVVMVDTTAHLTAMSMVTVAGGSAVRVGAGATMDALLQFLEDRGYGLTATPAPGDITVAGALAINGHGTSIPATNETRVPGHTYGSLSNLMLSADVVAWDDASDRYELKMFDRSHPSARALMTHLGRAFITSLTLRVGANNNVRCVSYVDIPAVEELFAAPGTAGARTFASFLDQAGRAEAIWFPFTEKPWLKVWHISPEKPLTSREVGSPYNYPFSDNVPDELQKMADEMVTSHPESTPAFGQAMYGVTAAGLVATGSSDIWGKSKNLLLYVKPSTLRVTANGYAVLTSRDNVQQILHDWAGEYLELVAAYRDRGLYPANMPVEIRVTGLDDSAEADFPKAQESSLSSIRPWPARTDWDVAVWFDVLSFPGTRGASEFYAELEQWMANEYSGTDALMRPEWSKGWAYTAHGGAWTDSAAFTRARTSLTPEGRAASTGTFASAADNLHELDPHGIFTTALHANIFS